MSKSVEREERYGARNYAPLPVELSRGEGIHVWDVDGRRYIDMLGAYSALSHGHRHPRLVKALCDQANRLGAISRAFYSDRLGPFLERACTLTGQDLALPMNSGAEAVETAIKCARKWAYKVKGVPDGKAEIIACDGNFHGRTIAVLGMSMVAQYRDGFGPFPDGFKRVPFGDAKALEAAITPNTAAFLVEPIQGEGGINLPPDGYLKACAEICRRHNVLLICDEVQTGLARTGRFLALDYEGIKPDGITLGKALGGGLIPVSLFLARREVMEVFTPGDHGSTFGGNPIAAAVGFEALNVIVEEKLADRAAELGPYFMDRLREARFPAVKDVRGRGLLIGIQLDRELADAHHACELLLANGVLAKDTLQNNVVRLAPPLIITKEQIDEALERITHVLSRLARRPAA